MAQIIHLIRATRSSCLLHFEAWHELADYEFDKSKYAKIGNFCENVAMQRSYFVRVIRWITLICALILGQQVLAARVALVVGNSTYSKSPLENPVNDARAMASKLQSLGFRVIKKENLRQREIGSTLRELRGAIKPGDEVLFFYAGHGLQVKGVNYLPTVDSDIQSEDDVPLQSMSLDQLLGVLDESKAGVKLLFLDACRNNPYSRSFRSASGSDLGRIGNASSGTLIHYATRPGSVADDGKKAVMACTPPIYLNKLGIAD